MVENTGVFRGFGRSQELVRGNGWSVFTVIVITVALIIVAGLVAGLALAADQPRVGRVDHRQRRREHDRGAVHRGCLDAHVLPPARARDGRVRLSIGEVLGEAWNLYTRHAGKLILMCAAVFAVISLVPAAIGPTRDPGLVAVVVILDIAAIALLQGALAVAVGELRAGRTEISIGRVLSKAGEHFWSLVVAVLLLAIVVVGGLILLIVPGLVLLTYTMAVVPAVVLEGRDPLGAFQRSFALVRGDGLAVFAIIVLTTLVSVPYPPRSGGAGAASPLRRHLPRRGSSPTPIVMPFVALAWTITYFDLKLNKG